MSQPKQGNYFMLPNEIFNMDLTAGEIALYPRQESDGERGNAEESELYVSPGQRKSSSGGHHDPV